MKSTMLLFSARCLKDSRRLRLGCLLAFAVLLLPAVGFAACGTAPTVSFDKDAKYAGPGKSVDFIVSITNNDAASCDFDLVASGDAAGFTSLLVDGTPFTVAGSSTDTTTLRVDVGGGVAEWTVNTTDLSVDAVNLTATTTAYANSPLLHNSINTQSTKHGGNWGTSKAGAKYGNFTCATCHVKNSGNIKRVRTSITTPDNSLGSFPGDGQPIVFQTVVDGSADFGDDSGGHVSSDRICEICHSYDAAKNIGVDKHAYSIAGDAGHFNQKDCMACHKHNRGFKAGACSACHGGSILGAVGTSYWPDASNANPENDTPGRHLAHMNALSLQLYGVSAILLLDDPAADSKQVDLCGYCHDNPGGDADHSLTLPAETAFLPVWDKGAAAGGSYGGDSCSNIACHNNKATGVGSYGWTDSGTSSCIMCHNDMTSGATTTGNTHNDHMNAAATFGRNISCADCHDSATDWGGNVKPAASHINGVLDMTGGVTLTYTGSAPPSTSFGGCGTNSCHNNGQGGVPANNGYAWNNNNLSDCTICHAAIPAGGSHGAHVATSESSYGGGANWAGNKSTVGAYDFGCGNCHGSTLSNHLNGVRNVSAVDPGWNGTSCSATYCHSHKDLDGTTTVNVATPAWGGSFAGDRCAGCHKNSPESAGHEEHQLGFHSEHVYSGKRMFLPVRNSDPLPGNLVLGPVDNGDADAMDDSFDPLRGHGGKLADGTITSTIFTCYVCHNNTVNTKPNDQATLCRTCHDDVIAPRMGDMVVADKRFHVNGVADVAFVPENVRSKAQVRDDLMDVPELSNNWTRVGGYKVNDGSSYDEQPDTLANMAASYGGWNNADKTCQISCHLWETGRVDKYPIDWIDNSIHGPQPIMCIDCHTRLPK